MPTIYKKRNPVEAPRLKHKRGLRAFAVGEGMPALGKLRRELDYMTAVLLGREEPPYPGNRIDALMEVADAFYARSAEMTALIQRAEADGKITKSSAFVRFRTGELRTFMEMAKRASELGSRRITVRQMQVDAERTGRDSRF